ncbi:hypothetical protein [Rosistilla oblonga]|uniref:hypothetical protein n=1 Tax=Rosistilla oblonga TaxID=2527990 RepID=UPI003A975EBF
MECFISGYASVKAAVVSKYAAQVFPHRSGPKNNGSKTPWTSGISWRSISNRLDFDAISEQTELPFLAGCEEIAQFFELATDEKDFPIRLLTVDENPVFCWPWINT